MVATKTESKDPVPSHHPFLNGPCGSGHEAQSVAQSDLGARFSLPALSYPPLPFPFRLLHLVHQLLLQFLHTSSAHT